MGLSNMRAGKDAVMFRIANAAHNYGLTPNMMTAMGLAFGLVSGVLFAFQTAALAFVFGFLSVFCDVLDGTLARRFHLESKFGLVFDSAADRTTETAVVLGALLCGIINPFGLMAIAGSLSLLACRTVSYRREMKTDYVMFGRFERLVFILTGLLAPIVWVSTLCFVAAGVLGLVSSCQIAFNLSRPNSSSKLQSQDKKILRI